jgi:hypothetical protein
VDFDVGDIVLWILARDAGVLPILIASVILPLILSFSRPWPPPFMAYGVHPGWVHYRWGLG